MITFRHFSVRYNGATEASLLDVCLDIERGKFTLVTGATGSGKSTLLMAMNGILHHESGASLLGEVRLDGRLMEEVPLKQICTKIGSVFQNPSSQISAQTVEREVAFGLENLGIERKEMNRRIDRALSLTGLQGKRLCKTRALSGGQKQRLVIAAALAVEPDILLLDEPLSRLDPEGADEIMKVISDLKRDQHLAIVMVEHRLEGPLRFANTVVVLNKGRVKKCVSPYELMSDPTALGELDLKAPPLIDLFGRLHREERPFTAEEAPLLAPRKSVLQKTRQAIGEEILRVKELDFAYGRTAPLVFKNLSMSVYKKDRIALLGRNGAGKSTLLHLLSGSLKPFCGRVERTAEPAGPIGLVMQDPDLMLIADSVEEELAFAPLQTGAPPRERMERIRSALDRMCLKELANRAPFSLSQGERLRTATASVLTLSPSILLLDEPTCGQDRARIDAMMSFVLRDIEAAIFATHDMEIAAKHANRVILLSGEGIVADGPPNEVLFDQQALAAASIRPSEMQRFAVRHHLHTMIVEELVEVFG